MLFKKSRKSPKFASGELVRIKSRENISKLIQPTNKLDGFLFMDQMWNYCGNMYPVLKLVDSIFNEHQKRTFRPRANIYILENILCDGNVEQFQSKCDHACFLLWHEDWLEKAQ